jgi:hypothetical protein
MLRRDDGVNGATCVGGEGLAVLGGKDCHAIRAARNRTLRVASASVSQLA